MIVAFVAICISYLLAVYLSIDAIYKYMAGEDISKNVQLAWIFTAFSIVMLYLFFR